MTHSEDTALTEDEAALYDRQIRLWGLDAQKRLRSSRVLIIGAGGLGAEVSKNIVLSGIKHLTLLDEKTVHKHDAVSQFLIEEINEETLKRNRAEASIDKLSNLNPMVEIVADTEPVSSKSEDFFTKFNVIFLSGCSRKEQIRISRICCQHDIGFFAGDTWGLFGYFFADLQTHEYVEEVATLGPDTSSSGSGGDSDGEPAAKKPKRFTDSEKQLLKRTDNFIPLEDALGIDWSSENYEKLLKKTSPSYFLVQVFLEFRDTQNREPLDSDEDLEILKTLRDQVLDRINAPKDKVPDELLRVTHPLNPSCAIVGGILAQELIKYLSKQDAPFNNFFFFTPNDCCGLVEKIGH